VSRLSASAIVLITDDGRMDRQLRDALQTTAPDFELRVVQTREQLEALHTPRVIVLDLMLSHEPAFDLLRWLRSHRRFERTPVFALGSPAVKHDIRQAYALGANSCFQRTTGTEELRQIARGLAGYASLVTA
jgi:DNA-binding response OmpR family regulator